jgi:hypothetical protein
MVVFELNRVFIICFLVLMIAVFFASIAAAIYTQYFINLLIKGPASWFSKSKRHIPGMFLIGDEMMTEMGKNISEPKKQSLSFWIIRILAIEMATVAVFFIIFLVIIMLSEHGITGVRFI